MSFESELRVAEAMIASASAIADPPTEPVAENQDGSNIAGAPDPSTARRDIMVRWVQAAPPPFEEIRAAWVDEFGFSVTSQGPDGLYLAKRDMRASVGQGMEGDDGSRNVWFGVSTGTHPADEVPEPG